MNAAEEASAFYRWSSTDMANEAADLPEAMDSTFAHVMELAGIALVASYQELNPHDAVDSPWCSCQLCQKWLFEMRWARMEPRRHG